MSKCPYCGSTNTRLDTVRGFMECLDCTGTYDINWKEPKEEEVPLTKIYVKGKDEIPNGLYILRIHGENWPTAAPYDRKVEVCDPIDESKGQFIYHERCYVGNMSQIKDGSTFEVADFDPEVELHTMG